MGLLEIASSKSVWRGIDYYKEHKILSCDRVEEGIFDAIVKGSNDENYNVHVDSIHPRKSTCNCPLANGTKTICKHIVAVYISTNPSEAERFKEELTPYASEVEERHAKRYANLVSWAKGMSPRELREAYVEAMIRVEDLEYELRNVRKH